MGFRFSAFISTILVLAIASPGVGQGDRHDEILCNCYELHKTGVAKTNQYAHDHNDGWWYYRCTGFKTYAWTAKASRVSGTGLLEKLPALTETTATDRTHFVNGSCDSLMVRKNVTEKHQELINHTFSGSQLTRATWSQLTEIGISRKGTTNIGVDLSGGLFEIVELSGAQNYAVEIGNWIHQQFGHTETFEAEKTVSNNRGQMLESSKSIEVEGVVPPCKVGVLTRLTSIKGIEYEFTQSPHRIVCKYEGTIYDTKNHVTLCPQGTRNLVLYAEQRSDSYQFFTRDISLIPDFEAGIVSRDFQCDHCDDEGDGGPSGG